MVTIFETMNSSIKLFQVVFVIGFASNPQYALLNSGGGGYCVSFKGMVVVRVCLAAPDDEKILMPKDVLYVILLFQKIKIQCYGQLLKFKCLSSDLWFSQMAKILTWPFPTI